MHNKRASADRAMAKVAGRQHGVISMNQLAAIGVDRHRALRRERTGRLHRIHQGVYAVGHAAPHLCRRHRLPAPAVNVRVGPHLVDFLWRDRNLIVETDGYAYHAGRVAFQDDRDRDLDLRTRGFQVIRLAEKQVNEEPRWVMEVVSAALRVGADVAQGS